MRPLFRALAVAAAGALAATLVAAPASAVPTQTLNPPTLPRGADVRIPHVEKNVVVDGALRIAVKAVNVRLIGKSGTAYIVGTSGRDGSGGRVIRLEANGTSTDLGPTSVYETVLSGDGQTVVSSRTSPGGNTTVKARSATTGAVVGKQVFDDYLNVLDAEGTKVIVGGYNNKVGTQLWDTASDTVTKVSRRFGYQADLSLDLLASYSKDPYDGGCTVLSSVTQPGKRLWESCNSGIAAFSTDGSHFATDHILTDGLGPTAVKVRTITGKTIGSYEVHGWFEELVFESPSTLLLDTHGPRKTAVVRCTAASCERAGDLTKNEPFPS